MSLTAESIAKFETLVTNLKLEWSKIKPATTNWLTVDKSNLGPAFKFLFRGADELVALAANIEAPGADKKAIVLASINEVLTIVMDAELPTALKPAEGTIIKILDSVLDELIELIVSKLNELTAVKAASQAPSA